MKTTTSILAAIVLAATAIANPALPFDTPPKAERTVAATKPAGTEAGIVSLLVTITTNGAVSASKVLKSTRAEFEAPAQEAVAKWTFSPALKDGKPVEATIVVPIRFSLEAGE